jgi:Cation/multidrug efflux pump
VDVDWMMEDDHDRYRFEVDKEKAMQRGVVPAMVTANIRAALSGMPVGIMHDAQAENPVNIVLQLSDMDKASIEEIKNIKVINQMGQPVAIGDIAVVKKELKEKSIARKNQKRVVYVTGDMAGALESPVYALMNMNKELEKVQLPEGYSLTVLNSEQPENETDYSLKWDGEWQITYEVFRDLGIAFLVAIIIIYMLIVGWFQSFSSPIVMLAAIPLSLIGIILGHWIMGAYFSATSMIGFIALAGVMVRNSLLLIDFINIRLKEGVPIKQAIIESGAVRSIPIILTAGTVVIGAIVILFDPLFQGLAISLMGGTITSTLLTLVVVPLLYYKLVRNKYADNEKNKLHMKLIVVMSVEDVKDSILAILQKASVPVLSMVDTKGMKPAVSLAFAASWLGKEKQIYNSLLYFSFTDEEKANRVVSLIDEYNNQEKCIFPAHAFVLPVENSSLK